MKHFKLNFKMVFAAVILMAIVRYFFKIWVDTFSFLDEYATYDAAAGFFHTGKFYFWDFHHNVLSSTEYTRAWPHTILLALWYRVFGMSVVSAKCLSGLFGVLSAASLFYVTRKIFNDMAISFLSCLIFMVNVDVTTYFRQIRMYSLWILLMIWFMYVAFLTLTYKPAKGDAGGGILSFQIPGIPFSFPLIAASFALLMLSYFVHINTLVAVPGMMLFLIYQALVRREKRSTSLLVFALIIIVVFMAVGFGARAADVKIPVVSSLYHSLTKGNIALRPEPNTRYFDWMQRFYESELLFSITVCLLAVFGAGLVTSRITRFRPVGRISLTKALDCPERQLDFLVYCLLIIVSSALLFIYILTRYYSARYMIYIAPLLSILAAFLFVWAIRLIGSAAASIAKREAALPLTILALTAALSLVLLYQAWIDYYEIYSNSEIPRHTQIYELIKEDYEKDGHKAPLAIAGYDIRYNYLNPVIEGYEYNTLEFERDGRDMERLKAFMKDNPTGYITIETSKLKGMDDDIEEFLDTHELISGPDIHPYGITVVKY